MNLYNAIDNISVDRQLGNHQ